MYSNSKGRGKGEEEIGREHPGASREREQREWERERERVPTEAAKLILSALDWAELKSSSHENVTRSRGQNGDTSALRSAQNRG